MMARWKRVRILLLGVAALCLVGIGALELTTRPVDRAMSAVAYSPSGDRVVALSAERDSTTGRHSKNGRLWIWDARTGKQQLSAPLAAVPLALAFHPTEGSFAVGGWDGSVSLFDPATGRQTRTFSGHSRPVRGLSFTPDGKTLVAGASDGLIIFWDAKTGNELRRLDRGIRSPVNSLAVSPDGRFLVAAGGMGSDSTTLWDLQTGQPLKRSALTTAQEPLAFAPHSSTLVAGVLRGRGTLQLIDLEADLQLKTFATKMVRAVAVSPDGLELASGGDDELVKVRQIASGSSHSTFDGHKTPPDPVAKYSEFALAHFGVRGTRLPHTVWSVAFSPEGSQLASAAADGAVWLWSLPGKGSEAKPHLPLLQPPIRSTWPRPTEFVLGVVTLVLIAFAIGLHVKIHAANRSRFHQTLDA